ncbi:hypothetical protein [Paucibacter soli]|uniref:hypothetical protein n=1 Tax=Paucibacter soli TaxID=3133433 RepID=UPI003099D80C
MHLRGAGMAALLVLLLLAQLTACAGQTEPLAAHSAASTGSGQNLSSKSLLRLRGLLSRKGPAGDSYWAITDAEGLIWRCESPQAQLLAQLQELQQRQVEALGTVVALEPERRFSLEQIRPSP